MWCNLILAGICGSNEYCEPSTQQCKACYNICFGGTPVDCKILCPGWKGSSITTAAPEVPPSHCSSFITPTYLSLSLSIIILSLVLIVLMVVLRRRVKLINGYLRYRTEKSRGQCTCNKKISSIENGKLHDGTDKRRNVKSADIEIPHVSRSGNGSIVTRPSQSEQRQSHEEALMVHAEHTFSMIVYSGSDNDVNYTEPHSVEESTPAEETQPKLIQLSSSEDRMESAVQLSASQLHAVSEDEELCSEHFSMSLQLRSSPALLSDSLSRRSLPPVTFDHVMNAYDAYDQYINCMPFVRGCRVCNDRLQVYVTESGDLENYQERVMNAIPINVPLHHVSVEHQPRYAESAGSAQTTDQVSDVMYNSRQFTGSYDGADSAIVGYTNGAQSLNGAIMIPQDISN